MHHRWAAIAAVGFGLPSVALGQGYAVVFEGRPLRAVESSFELSTSRELSEDESFEYSVRIVERGGKYYWASRDMKELLRSESGVYITYHALDGSGYVRVGSPRFLGLGAYGASRVRCRPNPKGTGGVTLLIGCLSSSP